MRSRAFLSYQAWRRAHPDQRPETVAVILAAANRLHLVDDPDVDRPIGHAGHARNRRRRGQRCRRGMAISPMASRAMALSYSRLDRLIRIDTAGGRTIRIVWIVNTLLALSTMLSEAANFFS
jgi:hypothetical protein